MNQTKVGSWLYFFLGLACFLIPGSVAVFIAYDRGISFAPVLMFTAIVIWGGLFWLFPFTFGRLGKGKKKVTFDERDQLIHKKSGYGRVCRALVIFRCCMRGCLVHCWSTWLYFS